MSTRRLLPLLLFSMLAACTIPAEPVLPPTTAPMASAVSASTSPTVAPATPTPLPTRYATRRPTITATPAQIPPTKTPTLRPTSAPIVAAPPGLIYSAGKAQWQIATDGRPKSVKDQGQPNGPYHYYTLQDKNNLTDIWVEEVATGKRRNLTNTPKRYEDSPLAWPQNSDILVFYSTPGMPDGAGYIGELTTMRVDGTGYRVVSQKDVSSPAAFSPDGHTLAYAIYDEDYPTPWFYRVGFEPQRFPWKDFGLQQFATMGFSSPSWSPDGQKIAWWMWSSGENYKPLFDGIGLFDLEKGQVALLDSFAQFVPDGWPSPVEWSPDGKRVLFYAQHSPSQERENDGIWIANADGRNLRHLINVTGAWYSCRWAWRPDGQWLAISCRDQDLLPGIWLAELETGKLLKTNLPDDAQIRGWVNPRP